MMPPRCASCPVALSQAAVARGAQRDARHMSSEILTSMSGAEDDQPSIFAEAVRDIRNALLEGDTETELRALSALGALATGAENCPGSRRGSPAYMPLMWRLQNYIEGKRICRNPNLGDLYPGG
jgi:hypothetical protein